MCNLSQGIMERGIEKGMAQGMAKGMERGEEMKARETAVFLKELGKLSLQVIADAVGFDVLTVTNWLTPISAN